MPGKVVLLPMDYIVITFVFVNCREMDINTHRGSPPSCSDRLTGKTVLIKVYENPIFTHTRRDGSAGITVYNLPSLSTIPPSWFWTGINNAWHFRAVSAAFSIFLGHLDLPKYPELSAVLKD